MRPVGSPTSIPFDARIVAATNRNLGQAIERGTFRQDLFYRLHVIPIFLPPLRERREDIPLLVEHFLRLHGERSEREMAILPDALRHMMRCDWPGNVRELENTIQRAFALIDDDAIKLSDMSLLFPHHTAPHQAPLPTADSRLASHEKRAICEALDQAQGNKREAARILGIGIATLYRKIKRYEIPLPSEA